jgi:F420-dependent oxidoreductase-like protein
MRLGITLNYGIDFLAAADEVVEYERVGAEVVAVAEAYSFDAVSQLGYLAAVTKTVALSTAILPIYTRTPTLIAMTAAGIDALSGGRFELGLGASGAQVIEGFHGVPYDAPLGRIREIIEICRAVWRRERIEHDGKHYSIPLGPGKGTGLGKPLKIINTPVRSTIPIGIAALTPASVAQTAEIADAWLPLFFHPGRAENAWADALAAGTAKRSSELGPLQIEASTPLFIGENTDEATARFRDQLALYIGGMGARGKNFYNDLAVGYGYGDAAALIQELYLTGRKQEAADAVPQELADAIGLIGTESALRERLETYRAAGVTTLSVTPLAPTRSGRIESVEAVRALL